MTAVPYDDEIKGEVDRMVAGMKGVTSKKMFGGVCYLYRGNMAFGIYKDCLIVRLGSQEQAQRFIEEKTALPFDITGRPMKGWVMIPRARLNNASDYSRWLARGLEFARSLPAHET